MVNINGTDYGDNWLWLDEFSWSPIIQTVENTVTGALVIEEHTLQAGRPITLSGEWLTRAQVDALESLRNVGGAMTLVYRSVSRTVYWRHGDSPLEADQVHDKSSPAAGDFYDVTLRFIEG